VTGRAAVFLDRDGVLTELVPDPSSGLPESPLRAQDVRLVAGAAAAAGRLRAEGYLLAVVSNQPAAAKGAVPVERLHDVHRHALELLAAEGVRVDAWRLCLHHPDGVVPSLSGSCDCRKPAPGMLLDAGRELGADMTRSWMVGDTDADVEAGLAAGCRTVLIGNPGSEHKRSAVAAPDLRARARRRGALSELEAVGRRRAGQGAHRRERLVPRPYPIRQ
jgi:D-glycero-D-manno-heptose 1,7-bisphosphate phosphatase